MDEALKSDSCKDLESGCISSAKTKVQMLNNNNDDDVDDNDDEITRAKIKHIL